MPAPDLKSCYNYQNPLEKAHCYLFGAAGIVVYAPAAATFVDDAWREANPALADYIFSNEDEFQSRIPRLQLRVITGAATKHYNPNTVARRMDCYEGTLRLVLITKNNTIEHREYLAEIRGIMGGDFDYTHVPYHKLNKCLESGLSEDIDAEKGLMITGINHDLHISINPDAWPEAYLNP